MLELLLFIGVGGATYFIAGAIDANTEQVKRLANATEQLVNQNSTGSRQ